MLILDLPSNVSNRPTATHSVPLGHSDLQETSLSKKKVPFRTNSETLSNLFSLRLPQSLYTFLFNLYL